MRKVIVALFIGLSCLAAQAQESDILDNWSAKMNDLDDEVLSSFTFLNFTYNHNLAIKEGMTPSGFGAEFSFLHLGFSPWSGARFSLGLADFTWDIGFLKQDYEFNLNDTAFPAIKSIRNNNHSSWTQVGVQFPLGYTQRIGFSKWSAAVFVAPGLGWVRYENKYQEGDYAHRSVCWKNKAYAYFHMDVKAMIWYSNVGVVVRYSFPKAFAGPGIVAAGISLRI